jgi:hypothetical protein
VLYSTCLYYRVILCVGSAVGKHTCGRIFFDFVNKILVKFILMIMIRDLEKVTGLSYTEGET